MYESPGAGFTEAHVAVHFGIPGACSQGAVFDVPLFESLPPDAM
jgi:hypothetical protein